MRNFLRLLIVSGLIAVTGCTKDTGTSDPAASPETRFSSAATSASTGSGRQGGEAGVVTAGEWNDLANWSFWKNILDSPQYAKMPGYWSFFTTTRLPVTVVDQSSNPLPMPLCS